MRFCLKKPTEVVCIQTVDTDLVVIAISIFNSLKELGLSELYIRYGVADSIMIIPSKTSAINWDPENV